MGLMLDREPRAARQALLRPAHADDAEAVLRLWSVARCPASRTLDDLGAIRRLIAHDRGALLVAQLGDRVVGTVIAGWDGWRGRLYRLAVLPEHRRRGIGRQLVVAGHERLRALGAARVEAAVADEQREGIAFWQALGYRRDPAIARFAIALTAERDG